MEVDDSNIFDILNGKKQFLIPAYQRIYSWTIEQCDRLWKDIVDMQKEGKEGHFVGSIVNIAEKTKATGVSKYTIIDGQQRITTLTLLLAALRDYGNEHPEDTSIDPEEINNELLKNQYGKNDEKYKLLLTKTDRDTLIDLVDNKPITEGTSSRLLINYEFFRGKINSMVLTPVQIYESIGKLQIANITLDRNKDDPQAIFESLNSTGKELSESDLIRNYVLMGLEPEEQKQVYDYSWYPMEQLFTYETQEGLMDRFFRDYLTMKNGRIPKQNRVYEEFKIYRQKSWTGSIGELCKDLRKFAKYYTDIVYKNSTIPALEQLYIDISDLRMEVVYPFLLKVLDDREENIISEDDLEEIIGLCISYVLRRGVCDIPTNSLNKTFAALINKIKIDDYVNSIKAFFVLGSWRREFPNDEKFKKTFMECDIYNMRTRNFILSHLEKYENKSCMNIEKYTIEHIMPQNSKLSAEWQKDLGENWKEIQKTYLHTIGNLTLTAYNSEMSDKPFVEKRDMKGGFIESGLRLNSYLIKLSEWNEDHIKERAEQLADKALKIWPYPQISEEDLSAYCSPETPEPTYSLESYDTNEVNKTLFDALDKRIMNLSADVRREYKKQYVAYKLETNFADVVLQADGLCIIVNMKFADIIDPKGICDDVTDKGTLGNGGVRMHLNEISEIDNVMEIIQQSYNKQAD